MKGVIYFIILILLPTKSVQAISFGHLMTGTTDVLKKNQVVLGTHIAGVGVTDKLVVGTSPYAYFAYQFYSLIIRYDFHQGETFSSGMDLFYFSSDRSKLEFSKFEQESYYLRLNSKIYLNQFVSIFLTGGAQYFINETSTYSFRTDPLGKYTTFGSVQNWDHEDRLRDFESNPRDPKTISISIMPRFNFTENIHLNLEYGVLGVNYLYPMEHTGISLGYDSDKFSVSFGSSVSSRVTPDFNEKVAHVESSLHMFF